MRGFAPKMMSTGLRTAVALLTLGLAACGGTGTVTGTSPDPAAIGVAGGNLGTPAVTISATDQNTFEPVTQNVTVGEIVEWKDTGSVAHNVVFVHVESISDPVLAGGGVWQVRFTTAGTYQYSCTIHAGMVGTIVVGAPGSNP